MFPSRVNLRFFALAALAFLFGVAPSHAAKKPFVVCESTLVSQPAPLENLDQVLAAFSHGFLPDLLEPNQRAAFEVYLKLRFGNPATRLEEVSGCLRYYGRPKTVKEMDRAIAGEVKSRRGRGRY